MLPKNGLPSIIEAMPKTTLAHEKRLLNVWVVLDPGIVAPGVHFRRGWHRMGEEVFLKTYTDSAQILEALGTINVVTAEVRGASSEMKLASASVVMEIRTLLDISEEVRRGIGEIAVGTEEIDRSMVSVSDLSHKNAANIAAVSTEAGLFKII